MGDFYEVFFEDAKDCSKILNIALTHRGKLGETPVPMAGIPHHAANNYIDKITEAGRRVAVCEQVENPKDAVGIVKGRLLRLLARHFHMIFLKYLMQIPFIFARR